MKTSESDPETNVLVQADQRFVKDTIVSGRGWSR